MATHQTAKTQFVESNWTKYAYRRFGKPDGVPLVFLTHFRGTMDHWDPALINTFASARPVVLVDLPGVGHSSGTISDNIQDMADQFSAFLSALNLETIDLLGYSMGGMVAQLVALNSRKSIRKLILASTGPSAGPGLQPGAPEVNSIAGVPDLNMESFLKLFFAPSNASQTAGSEFWKRINERQEVDGMKRADYVAGKGVMAQGMAMGKWSATPGIGHDVSYERLGDIQIPVFVANGNSDIMMRTVNSFVLSQRLPNAHLHIYPDSAHGFFQYASLFVEHATNFLDS